MARAAAQNNHNRFALYRSAVVAIADPVTIDVEGALPHCFAGVEFYSDAAGTTQVAPTAGTVAIEVSTVVNGNKFEAPPDNIITASAPGTVGWDANTKQVKATPASVSGNSVSHYRLLVAVNAG